MPFVCYKNNLFEYPENIYVYINKTRYFLSFALHAVRKKMPIGSCLMVFWDVQPVCSLVSDLLLIKSYHV